MDATIKNGKIDGTIINLYQKVGGGEHDNKCAFCRQIQSENWLDANREEFIQFDQEAFRICDKCVNVFYDYVDETNTFIPFFTFKVTYYFEQIPKGLPFLLGMS